MGDKGQTSNNLAVHRVNQLDAIRLDEELLTLFRQQLLSSLRLFDVARWERFTPELDALLHGVYFWFTVRMDEPSPGNRYQNLKYHDGWRGLKSHLRLRQKFVLGACNVILRYLWLRLERLSAARRWAEAPIGSPLRIIRRLMTMVEKLYVVLSTLNFVAFLWFGNYRSVPDRLARSQLSYIRPNAPRTVSLITPPHSCESCCIIS
mmetsp:Transcript_12169/g.37091  ORF Transcript_12169/g.37091 Transcript_12169/m.37091 type:complete len:206 (-) Transcript_12169:1470-2087(-)